jgi:hypothetical protein
MDITDSIFSRREDVLGSGPVVDAVDVGLYGTYHQLCRIGRLTHNSGTLRAKCQSILARARTKAYRQLILRGNLQF